MEWMSFVSMLFITSGALLPKAFHVPQLESTYDMKRTLLQNKHYSVPTLISSQFKQSIKTPLRAIFPHHENVIKPGFNTTGNNK